MKATATPLSGLVVFEPTVFRDDRGWFMESFNQKRFDEAISSHVDLVQDNHSASKRGVLRGLHYQLNPFAQGKLVRVIQGSVWDVAVDIRQNSPTFGKWFGIELSAENFKQMWIPAGFAHGFITLSEQAEFLYKTSNFYDKASERSIRWDDADLAISWPDLGCKPVLAAKDLAASTFDSADLFD
jgi:dTDP-4-dehydrorhamnose 3,5-epimerase